MSVVPAVILLISAVGLAGGQSPEPAGMHGRQANHPHRARVFISPMGEPFRSSDPDVDLVGLWFAQADANKDGKLTLAEMQRDADRFFDTLDVNHDGEIDPDEISRYEDEIAPEIRGSSGMGFGGSENGGRASGGGGRGGRGGHGGGHRGGGGGEGRGEEGSSGSQPQMARPEGLKGAGRFGILNIPEPVASADYDFNRGISRAEFRRAAAERFLLLDVKHHGLITRDELPALPEGSRRHEGKGIPLSDVRT